VRREAAARSGVGQERTDAGRECRRIVRWTQPSVFAVDHEVEQAADRGGISRTTAYRYFPNQRGLLSAVYPDIDASSLLEADAPTDPA